MFAKAVALVSPDLAKWTIGKREGNAVAFYQTMEKILASHDLFREPNQTHLEFAGMVAQSFSDHPNSELIQTTVAKVTKQFNQVRFGNAKFDDATTAKLHDELADLKVTLANTE